jgi:acylphosphatase
VSAGGAERNIRARVLVQGRVQGVAFRHWAQSRARAASLAGFVRNLPDGSVEAEFEGPEPAVLAIVEAMRRGPSGARVARHEASFEEATGESGEFRIEY